MSDKSFPNACLLLARQRSGTNALRAVLTTNQLLKCWGEVFEPSEHVIDQPWNYFRYIRDTQTVASLHPSNHADIFASFVRHLMDQSDKPKVLFDVKYMSCQFITREWQPIGSEPYLFQLVKDLKLRVVHLQRKHYLRYVLSEEIAARNQKWHSREEGDVKITEVNLETSSLIEQLTELRNEDEFVSRCFAKYPHYVQMDYTELFPSLNTGIAQQPLERISELLEIEPSFKQDLWSIKSAAKPLFRAIVNFDEVRRTLEATEFEPLLEDEPLTRPTQRVA